MLVILQESSSKLDLTIYYGPQTMIISRSRANFERPRQDAARDEDANLSKSVRTPQNNGPFSNL